MAAHALSRCPGEQKACVLKARWPRATVDWVGRARQGGPAGRQGQGSFSGEGLGSEATPGARSLQGQQHQEGPSLPHLLEPASP